MSGIFYLAWRYVCYHRGKSALLIGGLTLTIVLPLTAHLLVRHYDRDMRARAARTPLVVGARGNRFDLILKALYFGSAQVETVSMAAVDRLWESNLAVPIPLQLEFTAREYPIVGTTLDYFDFRRLSAAQGTLPLKLGQAVLGARVATALGLGPGDHLFSDQQRMFDIASTYPLKMHISGVLAATGTPDDHAIFVDIKTAWIIAGISHGHQDVTDEDPNAAIVLERTEREVRTTAAIVEYNEVTPENIDSFHTHAPPEDLPLSAIVAVPYDEKSATILKARYRAPGAPAQALEPDDVVDELMGRVLAVQRVFNAAFALVALATGFYLVLIVLLSRRIRRRELEALRKIGCSRATTAGLQACELLLVLLASVALAAAISGGVLLLAPRLVVWV